MTTIKFAAGEYQRLYKALSPFLGTLKTDKDITKGFIISRISKDCVLASAMDGFSLIQIPINAEVDSLFDPFMFRPTDKPQKDAEYTLTLNDDGSTALNGVDVTHKATLIDIARLYPQLEPIQKIRLSMPLLRQLVEALSVDKKDSVDLEFYGTLEPVRFTTMHTQATGLIYPMRI